VVYIYIYRAICLFEVYIELVEVCTGFFQICIILVGVYIRLGGVPFWSVDRKCIGFVDVYIDTHLNFVCRATG